MLKILHIYHFANLSALDNRDNSPQISADSLFFCNLSAPPSDNINCWSSWITTSFWCLIGSNIPVWRAVLRVFQLRRCVRCVWRRYGWRSVSSIADVRWRYLFVLVELVLRLLVPPGGKGWHNYTKLNIVELVLILLIPPGGTCWYNNKKLNILELVLRLLVPPGGTGWYNNIKSNIVELVLRLLVLPGGNGWHNNIELNLIELVLRFPLPPGGRGWHNNVKLSLVNSL